MLLLVVLLSLIIKPKQSNHVVSWAPGAVKSSEKYLTKALQVYFIKVTMHIKSTISEKEMLRPSLYSSEIPLQRNSTG